MQDFLNQFPIESTEPPAKQYKIENVLEQLEQDVSCIKTSLEKKKQKVSLIQVNDKLDMIFDILRSWSTLTCEPAGMRGDAILQ